MRFVHFSDTHLGKKNFKIDERERDFEKAFEQVIDFAIEKKVDFIIHSGDIVDTGKPSWGTVRFLVGQLKKLKKENIMFFTVPGSHDVAPDGTVIDVLDKAGLLINLGNRRYWEEKDDKIILRGENYKGVFIAGMMGKRGNIEQVYKKLEINEKKGDYSIFIFHHIIRDISEKFGDIDKNVLPKGFDYYAGGHTHTKFIGRYDKGIVVYPGSTELWDIREKGEKGFFYFDKELEWIPLKTRKFEEIEINVEGNAHEITERIIEKIGRGEDSILIIKVKGKITRGSKSEINRKRIIETAEERGYLFANVYLSELSSPEEKVIEEGDKSLEEIELDYLSNKGYVGKKLKLAQRMIELLGKKMGGAELEGVTKAMIEEGKHAAKIN